MGRLLGGLKDVSAAQLGGIAIEGALARAGVAPEQIDYVIMGQVLTAGAGQMPARQAAVAAGIPMDVPALTINKVCLSGIEAISVTCGIRYWLTRHWKRSGPASRCAESIRP